MTFSLPSDGNVPCRFSCMQIKSKNHLEKPLFTVKRAWHDCVKSLWILTQSSHRIEEWKFYYSTKWVTRVICILHFRAFSRRKFRFWLTCLPRACARCSMKTLQFVSVIFLCNDCLSWHNLFVKLFAIDNNVDNESYTLSRYLRDLQLYIIFMIYVNILRTKYLR